MKIIPSKKNYERGIIVQAKYLNENEASFNNKSQITPELYFF